MGDCHNRHMFCASWPKDNCNVRYDENKGSLLDNRIRIFHRTTLLFEPDNSTVGNVDAML